jgi:hypothetical protein
MACVGALRTFGAPAPLTLGVRHREACTAVSGIYTDKHPIKGELMNISGKNILASACGIAIVVLPCILATQEQLIVKASSFGSGIGWTAMVTILAIPACFVAGLSESKYSHVAMILHAWLHKTAKERIQQINFFLVSVFCSIAVAYLATSSTNALAILLYTGIFLLYFAFIDEGLDALAERLQIKGYLA